MEMRRDCFLLLFFFYILYFILFREGGGHSICSMSTIILGMAYKWSSLNGMIQLGIVLR